MWAWNLILYPARLAETLPSCIFLHVKHLLLLLMLLGLPGGRALLPCLHGQELLAFRHLDSRHGLSQNAVSAIAQDGDGYMWFGTRNGLNRYDGYRMRTFTVPVDSLEGHSFQDIRTLYYDAHIDRLWIGTPQGLLQYCPRQDRFRRFTFPAAGLPDSLQEVFTCVLRDRQGQLWVGTDEGLYRWEQGGFAACAPPPQVQATGQPFDVRVLYEDAAGILWVGTHAGLFALRAEAHGQLAYLPPPPGPEVARLFAASIRFIVQDGEGAYWLGIHRGGVCRWQPGTVPRHYRHDPQDPASLLDNDVRAMEVGPQGRVWIGSFLGLSLYDPARGGFVRYTQDPDDPRSLGSGSVRAICFDARGSAWIGTFYSGVSYWHPDLFRFTHRQPLPGNRGLSHTVVSAFWEDPSGNLWIGTEGGGLNYWDRTTGTYTTYRARPGAGAGLRGNNVKALWGQHDSLWIGTFAAGLHLYHLRSQRWEHFEAGPRGLSSNNVYGLLQTGRDLWIATYGGGLNRLDLRTGQVTVYDYQPADPTSLSSSAARVLMQDRQGRLWIGTQNGLNRLVTGSGGQAHFVHYLPGVHVCALLAAADGTIWAGTYLQGLWQLGPEGEVLAHYTHEEGLPGSSAFGMLPDAQGHLWLSSEKGLARIDRRNSSLTDYNYSEGIDNLEYNFNACYEARSGEMFFGGTRGFTAFFPADIRTNTFVPPVVFTHLRSFNRPVTPGDDSGLLQQVVNQTPHLVFPYNRANFTLGFSALDYLNPGNNQYAYTLEGLDLEWKRVQGETEVSYTLQRPGTYTFRLKGGNNDGIWNPQERVLTITVLPPPWRSPLAYALYALLLGLLLAGTYWLIRMRHRLQLEQLTKVQQEELHQAKLRFYTNVTHEFRTPLTLILGPVEELLRRGVGAGVERQLWAIEHNAQRLLRLVNQLLTFRSLEQDHTALQVAPGNIVRFVHEVYLSFQEQAQRMQIDYRFESEAADISLWFDRDKLEKVLFNLLSNAFKFTPPGGRITVSLGASETEVWLRVQDTGPGIPEALRGRIFERYFHREGDRHPAQEGTGIGLTLSKELVELHGGQLTLEPPTAGGGACLCVRLPQGAAHFAPEHLLPDFQDSEVLDAYLERAADTPPAAEALWEIPAPGTPRQTLLVVEDNAAVAHYVRDIFAPYFHVRLAADGQAGLQAALDHAPDLIISDVMMPGMDGISLCGRLRRQVETSHIPLILLTARTGQIFRVEGLETGADAYLTKPFSPYELQLTVRNLLEARARIRERFRRVLKLEPSEVTLTSPDEAFLTRAIAIVEAHIDAPDFMVEDFAAELAVSRPLLFTKLKALTGQTPNNFVKALRLKRSAQLLADSKLGIAEVAYQVGFRDARYFAKCFQKEFGCTPSAYRESS